MDRAQLDGIADDLVARLGTGRQRDGFPGLGFPDAYAISERIRAQRRARGERPVGRKLGFTNTTIWDRYGVDGPMWSYVYDSTATHVEGSGVCDVAGLCEPRIEPEIVLRLERAPEAGMDAAALIGCVRSVAPGFEIVQSVYPGWRMTGPEAAAAYGLHGRLFVGPERLVAGDVAAWGAALAGLGVELRRGAEMVDTGVAANVLGGGPIAALGFLAMEIARRPGSEPLQPGEIVTTGTLTDAHPVAPGDRWSAAFAGVDLPALALEIVDSAAG